MNMREQVARSSLSDEHSKIDFHRDYSRCMYTWRVMIVGERLLLEVVYTKIVCKGLKKSCSQWILVISSLQWF